MAPAPAPVSSTPVPAVVAPEGGSRRRGAARLTALAVPHIAALAVMAATETDVAGQAGFVLSWAVLNFFWIALTRRATLSGFLSLAMVTFLIVLSRFKLDVLQITANFIDLMVVDQDTIAFLFVIFPQLKWAALAAFVVGAPLAVLLWRYDAIHMRRRAAALGFVLSFAALAVFATIWPNEPWQGFLRGGYVSKFVRSGVNAVSDYARFGFMESDATVKESLATVPDAACDTAARKPHIILVHDESSYDIRTAPGIKVPPGYGPHFNSYDGKARKFIVEGNGGPSWMTEYNVLSGLSSRSFGRFSYFVTRIASGRIHRGLPLSLRRCGYRTISLYPAFGAFMNARHFQTSTGIEKFLDARDLGARTLEPDRFFYDAARKLFDGERRAGGSSQPVFMFVYLAANHFPWDKRLRPDLTPGWRDPGNSPKIDEYLRRQMMSAQDYAAFMARLKADYPGESFLLVRFGDHQPEFSSTIIEPGIDDTAVAERLMSYDPRYFTTYYAIDAINFKPVNLQTAMPAVEAAYLPLIIQDAAGLPLDASFAEQKKIMLRCNGLFFACNGGAEVRRFNRLLIDAGLIKDL